MRRISSIPVLLIVLLLSMRARPNDESIEKLMARANSAGDHQAELCADVVRREVELANQYYTAGDEPHAQNSIKIILEYAQKTLDSARRYHKKLKETEITLRKAGRRLSDVGHTLALEDRPPVHSAVEKIEEIRSQLLDVMFAPKR